MSYLPYLIFIFAPLVFLAGRSRREIASVAALIAVFLVIHVKFLTGAVTVSWDTLAWAMILEYVKEVVQAGYFPDWNPYMNAGEPLYLYHYSYAIWQWFVFILIDYIIPVDNVTLFSSFYVFAHVFYAVGCYLLFTKLFDDPRISLFCFAATIFSVGFASNLDEFTPLYISLYVPYILYFFLEVVEEGNYRALVPLMGLVGVAANIYIPHFFFTASAVFVICYLIFMERGRWSLPRGKAPVLYGGAALTLMALIAAPQLFIFSRSKEYVSPIRNVVEDLSATAEMVGGTNSDLLGILNLINIVDHNMTGAVLFAGILPLGLFIIGAAKSSSRFRLPVLAAAAILFLVSLGPKFIFFKLFQSLPTFQYMRHYVVFQIYVHLLIVCVAGMGLEYILEAQGDGRRRAKKTTLVAFGIITAIYLLITALELELGFVGPFSPYIYLPLLIISFAAVYLVKGGKKKAGYLELMGVLVIGLCLTQWYLVHFVYPNTKYIMERVVKEGDYKTKYITERVVEERNYSALTILLALTALGADIYEPHEERANLVETFSLENDFQWKGEREREFEQKLTVNGYVTFEGPLKRIEAVDFTTPVDPEQLEKDKNLRYVKSILAKKDYDALYSTRKMHWGVFGATSPKLFLTRNYEVATGSEVVDLIAENSGALVERRGVVLDAEDLAAKGGLPEWETSAAPNPPSEDYDLQVTDYGPNHLTIEVDSTETSLLVYIQGFDMDWRAYVNGEERPIFRANNAFQAIQVPQGKSTVELSISSPYRFFLISHMLGVTVLLAVMIAYFIRKRASDR